MGPNLTFFSFMHDLKLGGSIIQEAIQFFILLLKVDLKLPCTSMLVSTTIGSTHLKMHSHLMLRTLILNPLTPS